MRNLFPTRGLLRSESPNDYARLWFILFQSELIFSSSFWMIPHRSEQNSHSILIRLMAQIHSEWYRHIPRSVQMISCHYASSFNESVAHEKGLDSEWFENRFRIYTESFPSRMCPKLQSGKERSVKWKWKMFIFSRLCWNDHISCVQCERESAYFESMLSAHAHTF